MMAPGVGTMRCSLFGDPFVKQLVPVLTRLGMIEIAHQVFVKRGTINALYKKLMEFYKKRERLRLNQVDCCVIMIGSYDVVNSNTEDLGMSFLEMQSEFSRLLSLISVYEKKIVLLTAVPHMKMNKKKRYWDLLKMYNNYLQNIPKANLRLLDLFSIFSAKRCALECEWKYYEKSIFTTKVPKVQLWNYRGVKRAAVEVLDAIGYVQKLAYVNTIEVHRERAPSPVPAPSNMGTSLARTENEGESSKSKSEDDTNQAMENAGSNGHDGVDDNGNDQEMNDTEQNATVQNAEPDTEETIPLIPEPDPVQLCKEMKEKINNLRVEEYSEYGQKMLKENNMVSIEKELFTVASYNVLSQDLLEKHKQIYEKHDQRSLEWNRRRQLLNDEFVDLNADILCLQEVDFSLFDTIFSEGLNVRGYRAIHKKKTRSKTDGCSIYYKSRKFDMLGSLVVELYKNSVNLLDRDNIGIIVKLSLKERPDLKFVVATTHLLYNPRRADLKLVQTQLMLAEIERFSYEGNNPVTGEAEYLPIIFTGDMNYYPGSAGHDLVTKNYFKYEGKSHKYLLPYTEGRVLKNTLLPATLGVTDSCQYLSSVCKREGPKLVSFETGSLSHPLKLSSVYSHLKDEYPEATTNQDQWVTVDYIFYSQVCDPNSPDRRIDGNLKLVSKLSLPNTVEAETIIQKIPNLACPSDHLPLRATFHITK